VLLKKLSEIDALGSVPTCKTFHIVLEKDMSVTEQKHKRDNFWVDLEEQNDRK